MSMMPTTETAAGSRFLPLWAREDDPWLAAPVRVVKALGEICRELRLQINAERRLLDTDFQAVTNLMPHGAGRSFKTLRGFEEGTSNPTRLDDVVKGYSQAAGVPVEEIWKRAIKRAADPAAGFERAVAEGARGSRSNSRKPGSAARAKSQGRAATPRRSRP